MSDQSLTLEPKTSKASPNVIFSQESQAGYSPSVSLAFQIPLDFGLAHAPANLFRAQGSSEDTKTPDTSGLSSTVSLRSANLQQFLANRLAQSLDTNGSPEYLMTWRQVAMPSRAPICRLLARGRRKSDTAYSGWPTAQAFDSTDCASGNLEERKKKGGCANLRETATIAGWPTTTCRYHKDGTEQSCQNVPVNALLGRAVHTVGWSSPSAQGSAGEISEDLYLRGQKFVNRETGRVLQSNLATEAVQLTGLLSHGPAGMEGIDVSQWRLNAFFSGWLQGYPRIWSVIGLRAVSRLRRKSKGVPRS